MKRGSSRLGLGSKTVTTRTASLFLCGIRTELGAKNTQNWFNIVRHFCFNVCEAPRNRKHNGKVVQKYEVINNGSYSFSSSTLCWIFTEYERVGEPICCPKRVGLGLINELFLMPGESAWLRTVNWDTFRWRGDFGDSTLVSMLFIDMSRCGLVNIARFIGRLRGGSEPSDILSVDSSLTILAFRSVTEAPPENTSSSCEWKL